MKLPKETRYEKLQKLEYYDNENEKLYYLCMKIFISLKIENFKSLFISNSGFLFWVQFCKLQQREIWILLDRL